MIAKKTINRNCLVPNEGGFRPAGSVVFNELAIDLILIHLGEFRSGSTGLTVVISPLHSLTVRRHPNQFGQCFPVPSAR
jgi:hypothetical protein